MRNLKSPYPKSCNLGRAAENNVGQEDGIQDMRKIRRPYDQSSNMGGPASKKVGPGDDGHLLLAGPPKILDWKWTQINQGQLGGSFGVHFR